PMHRRSSQSAPPSLVGHFRPDRPVPIYQQNRTDVGTGQRVDDHQLELAVAIHVGRGHTPSTLSSARANFWFKRAISRPEQDRNIAGSLIGHGQVEAAVAVEVSCDDAERM